LCCSSEFRQFCEARFFLQNLVLKFCYDSLCRELDFPDEIVEKIFEAAKMSIRLQKYKIRRMEWKKLVALSTLNKQWYRVLGKEGSEEIKVRFGDLPLKAKKIIFEMVARSVCLRAGGYSYKSQAADCKKLVACRVVCKSWNYWIGKACEGKEMRMGYIILY
jgi:hypothetical protein